MKKLVILFSGNSCSGKTTVQNILIASGFLSKIVTFTTRQPRENEVDGVDYNFISQQEARRKITLGECVEHAKIGEYFYGVEHSSILNSLLNDQDSSFKNSIPSAIVTPEALPAYTKFLNALNVEVVPIYLKCPANLVEKRLLERAFTPDVDGKLSKSMIEASFNRLSHYYTEEQLWEATWIKLASSSKNSISRFFHYSSTVFSSPINVFDFENAYDLADHIKKGVEKIVDEIYYYVDQELNNHY